MSIAALRESRTAAVSNMRRMLTTAESEKRSLNPAEQTAFDKIKGEIVDLEAQEGRAMTLEDFERRAVGVPVGDKQSDSLERQVNVMEVIRAQMEGRALSGAAAEYQAETERRTGRKAQGVFVPLRALEQRVSTTSTAGQIVGTDYRPQEFIEPFRNSLLARKLGVRVLSGLTGNVTVPKYGTGTTVGWVAENSALSTSDMTFQTVTLAPKHAGGITEMSRQLIQQASPDIEQLIRDDLSFMLAKAIDSALIKGGGTNEPTGVLATAGVQTASLATLSWANILAMLQKLDIVNATAVNIVASMKVKAKLQGTLKNSVNGAEYLMEAGLVGDLPAYFTNQAPEKTGTPNTGTLIAGDWSQVLLGVWSELDIVTNPYDSVAYARGGVLVRAMATVGIAVRHPEGFVIADDVTI